MSVFPKFIQVGEQIYGAVSVYEFHVEQLATIQEGKLTQTPQKIIYSLLPQKGITTQDGFKLFEFFNPGEVSILPQHDMAHTDPSTKQIFRPDIKKFLEYRRDNFFDSQRIPEMDFEQIDNLITAHEFRDAYLQKVYQTKHASASEFYTTIDHKGKQHVVIDVNKILKRDIC